MSLKFSKSLSIGPLRITFSKSGIGWSIGGKGFRTGVDSKGRKYNNISIPGTGVSKKTYDNNSPASSGAGAKGKNLNWIIVVCIFVAISIIRSFLK